MLTYDFSNKNVVITGAGSGIGFSTAKAFLHAGANVAIISRSYNLHIESLMNNYGNNILFNKADVSIESEVKSAFNNIFSKFGSVDILVNNASISGKGNIEDISLEEWNKVISTNLTGCFLCTREVIPEMKKKRYGKLIHVSSVAGRDRSMLLGASYTASKAAIIGFTRQVASEVARYNINSNCVAPSQTYTPMLEKIFKNNPNLEEMIKQKNPSGYIASPEQISNVILFLSSDESNYINGAIIDVNGGLY